MIFHTNILKIDARAESERIEAFLVKAVRKDLRRRGAVVGVSGGVDSSVVLALCARSIGPGQVQALVMPENDSDPQSETLAREVAERLPGGVGGARGAAHLVGVEEDQHEEDGPGDRGPG